MGLHLKPQGVSHGVSAIWQMLLGFHNGHVRHLQNLRRKSEEPGASLAKEPAEQLGSKGLGRDSAFKKTMQAMCRRAG